MFTCARFRHCLHRLVSRPAQHKQLVVATLMINKVEKKKRKKLALSSRTVVELGKRAKKKMVLWTCGLRARQPCWSLNVLLVLWLRKRADIQRSVTEGYVIPCMASAGLIDAISHVTPIAPETFSRFSVSLGRPLNIPETARACCGGGDVPIDIKRIFRHMVRWW